MKDETLLGPWVRRFLLEHLVAERNLSRNTQASYRDTLTLLLPFASKHGGRAIDRMTVEDLTPSIVRKFLDHLERDRQCSGVTRNQRLATIRSLARFIGMRSPVHVAWCAEIRSDAVQEDRQDRDRVSRKGRDGRPSGATGSAYTPWRSRPRAAPVLVQQWRPRRRGGKVDHRQPTAGRAIVSAATRQGKQVPDLSVVADHRNVAIAGWSPTGARATRSS